MNFEDWMKKVDQKLESICGLDSEDLSDCCYYDWFEAGFSPERAARKTLKENDF